MKIIDIIFICNTFVYYVIIIEIDYYKTMFHFNEEFFVFMSKKDNFRDNFIWEIIIDFKWFDNFGMI